MKKTLIAAFSNFLILILFCCSQNTAMQYQNQIKQEIPILIDNSYKEKLIIYDKNISDSLKVTFSVLVVFEYPLKDTIKEVIVNDVAIRWIHAVSLSRDSIIMDSNGYFDENKANSYQKYIWNFCHERFDELYRNQPYSNWIGKKQWGNRVVFGGNIYLFPSL